MPQASSILLLCTIASLLLGLCNAQYGDQQAVNVSFSALQHTDGWFDLPYWLWALVHLPDDYAQTTTKYPLIIYFHGAGEVTTTRAESDLSMIATRYGPCAEVYRGNPMQYTVNGVLYKFITVCPQLLNVGNAGRWGSDGGDQNNFLNAIEQMYRIDTNRIYITGISDGGFSTLGAAVNSPAQASRFAAIAPCDFTSEDNFGIPGMCNLASAGVPLWISCGDADFTYPGCANYSATYNECKNRTYTMNLVVIPGGEHDALSFNGAYTVNHTYNPTNIYEFFLSHPKGYLSTTSGATVAASATTTASSTHAASGSSSSSSTHAASTSTATSTHATSGSTAATSTHAASTSGTSSASTTKPATTSPATTSSPTSSSPTTSSPTSSSPTSSSPTSSSPTSSSPTSSSPSTGSSPSPTATSATTGDNDQGSSGSTLSLSFLLTVVIVLALF